MKKRPRHKRRLTVIILLSLANTFCATIDRGRSKSSISAAAEYGMAGNRSYGCGGEVLSEQRHHQIGGKVTYRYEDQHGLIAQADAGALFGSLANHFGFEPTRRDYFMGSIGGLIGYDLNYLGVDLGAGVLFDDRGRVLAVPRFNLRLGSLKNAWFETGIGPLDAPFDGRLLYGGIGLRGDIFRLNFGAAFIGRPLVNLDCGYDEITMGELTDNGLDLGGYATLTLMLGHGIGLDLGAIAAENFSGRLGLRMEF
ncbi:MAG TPA: hypothetical protein VM425_00110 [Myxococcota bacterium]|nr:hypothetical protein [Myxococcota bacterium]